MNIYHLFDANTQNDFKYRLIIENKARVARGESPYTARELVATFAQLYAIWGDTIFGGYKVVQYRYKKKGWPRGKSLSKEHRLAISNGWKKTLVKRQSKQGTLEQELIRLKEVIRSKETV